MTESSEPKPPRVAVALPCHNEAPAIAAVIAAWRDALPAAEIVVFDNASTDGTGDLARSLGVRVVDVPAKGKGNAVRAIFETLHGRDAVVMADGDGTYPADHVRGLLDPVLAGAADMAVGARRPVAGAGALSPVRGAGNVLIRAAFWVFLGKGGGDLLSGYRAFGPAFIQQVDPRSTGFEIEAELNSEAVGRGMRVVEIPVPYHPRIAGTKSKLNASRDGARILVMIASQSWRLRPARWAALAAVAGALGVALAALFARPGR